MPVTVAEDPDPDRVDLPDELQAALDLDPVASAAWRALTPGRQRTLAYGVGRAKRPETRVRRALALLDQVKAGSV
ncbi:MAG: YdeI/OmpD-associated family protein [Bacteroidota bacterium]